MTKEEAGKLIFVIKATYPQMYQKYTARDLNDQITVWSSVLEDYTYEDASRGLKIYLASDTNGYPPSPGQVIACIQKLHRKPETEMSGPEAWTLVRKAIKNSIYNSEEEFNKLPKAAQKAVGSPENLREMAQMETATVESVEQSHFIRAYNSAVKQQKEDEKIPKAIMALMEESFKQASLETQRAKGIEESEAPGIPILTKNGMTKAQEEGRKKEQAERVAELEKISGKLNMLKTHIKGQIEGEKGE